MLLRKPSQYLLWAQIKRPLRPHGISFSCRFHVFSIRDIARLTLSLRRVMICQNPLNLMMRLSASQSVLIVHDTNFTELSLSQIEPPPIGVNISEGDFFETVSNHTMYASLLPLRCVAIQAEYSIQRQGMLSVDPEDLFLYFLSNDPHCIT